MHNNNNASKTIAPRRHRVQIYTFAKGLAAAATDDGYVYYLFAYSVFLSIDWLTHASSSSSGAWNGQYFTNWMFNRKKLDIVIY